MFVHNSIRKHISFKCYNLIQSNIHNTILKKINLVMVQRTIEIDIYICFLFKILYLKFN